MLLGNSAGNYKQVARGPAVSLLVSLLSRSHSLPASHVLETHQHAGRCGGNIMWYVVITLERTIIVPYSLTNQEMRIPGRVGDECESVAQFLIEEMQIFVGHRV